MSNELCVMNERNKCSRSCLCCMCIRVNLKINPPTDVENDQVTTEVYH